MTQLKDIQSSQERISKFIKHTPLYPSAYFSKISNHHVYLKLENLQNTNAFKIRGASNYILQINPSIGKRGVITASSGNHGKAVAYVASRMGYPTKVVVPTDVPLSKVKPIKNYGAEVIYWKKFTKERYEKAQQLAKNNQLTFIDSVDHPWIIEGQGTVGLEIIEDLPDVEVVLVPIGGGGLISGISLAIKEKNPQVKIYGVEPIGSNSMYLSLQAGKITELKNINTIADGLRSTQPGSLAFNIVKEYVEDILLVTDEEIRIALKTLLMEDKLLAEPSGAVTLAALLAGKVPFENNKVVAVISGGNVDIENIKEIL
ncbi:L-threonine dehydratase catabolic TdcB [subsurface metagenome]|nr:MAG: threonine/serine dehydratase [Candidatus Atribacteria bacterium 1244-E10-H5-B2]